VHSAQVSPSGVLTWSRFEACRVRRRDAPCSQAGLDESEASRGVRGCRCGRTTSLNRLHSFDLDPAQRPSRWWIQFPNAPENLCSTEGSNALLKGPVQMRTGWSSRCVVAQPFTRSTRLTASPGRVSALAEVDDS
jgi:hypothetical protein